MARTISISNTDDIIDLRDVIERVEELEDELTARHEAGGFMSDFDDWILNSRDNSDPIHAAFGDEGLSVQTDIEDLYKFRALLDECKAAGWGDEQWRGDWYPVTLIRDSYFQDYAQEFAEDCGTLTKGDTWPYTCIDWEQAARELQMDYTSVEFDGVTYYTR